MQVYLTLLKRELGSFFMGLTGYVTMATVLLLLGVSFEDMITKLNSEPTVAPITEVFYNTYYFWIILLLTAPIITMRSFASEKSSGTYETLMTAPVGDLQVVLAKFSGALFLYTLIWLPLIGYMFLIHQYADNASGAIDPGTVGSTFLGIFLVGCVYMSMGCFASSITKSQIIAAMVSYGCGLTLFLLSLRTLMPMPVEGWESTLFKHVSMTSHMEDFSSGIIDMRAVGFYISLTILFLFWTWKAVEARRWR